MLNTVVIATDKINNLESLGRYLEKNLCNEVQYFSDPKIIIDTIENKSVLLIVKHDSLSFDSMELVQKVIKTNAFTNIAILGNDTSEKFKDKFEGFGILLLLSDPPNKYEIEILCKRLHA